VPAPAADQGSGLEESAATAEERTAAAARVSGFLLVKEEEEEGGASRTLRAQMDTQTAYIITLEEDNLRLREVNPNSQTFRGVQVKSTAELVDPRGFKMLDFSMYQPGIDFKCLYSNRPLKPLTPSTGLTQSLFSGTIANSPCLFNWNMSSAIDLSGCAQRLLQVESELRVVQQAQHGSRVCSTDASDGSMEERERPPSQHTGGAEVRFPLPAS
jgi:hypothetical protein